MFWNPLKYTSHWNILITGQCSTYCDLFAKNVSPDNIFPNTINNFSYLCFSKYFKNTCTSLEKFDKSWNLAQETLRAVWGISKCLTFLYHIVFIYFLPKVFKFLFIVSYFDISYHFMSPWLFEKKVGHFVQVNIQCTYIFTACYFTNCMFSLPIRIK